MLQFRLSDLLFATALVAILGAMLRLGVADDPWCYRDLWLLLGIGGTIAGVICLGLGWDYPGNALLPAAPFWTAIQNVFLQMRAFHVVGCGRESDQFVAGMAQEFWDQGEVGLIVIGATLLATLWIAFRRRWDVPWLLVPSLALCLVQLLLLNSGVWIIIHLGFGRRWIE